MATATATTILLTVFHRPHRLPSAATTISLLRNNPIPSFSLLHVTRPLTTLFPLHCSLQPLDIISEDINNNNNNKSILGDKREVPELSVKEKKELGSYANSLGDKLKSQQIGKSGITDNLVMALSETLEKNELLKLKIHKTCPGEIEDVVSQLEQATQSVVVGQIGRTVIFYRPSLTKLKAEQKKEQNRKIFEQRRRKFQTASTARKKYSYASE